MKPACDEFFEQLSAYADDELDAAAARRVAEHVASCVACREQLRAWREEGAALAAAVPSRSDVEWERLARRVEAAIDDGEAEEEANVATARVARAASRSGVPERWLWGGSGALVAAALVLLFWPWVSQQVTEMPPTFPHEQPAPAAGTIRSVPRSEPEAPAEPPRTTGERDVRRVLVPPDLRGGLMPSTAPEAPASSSGKEPSEGASPDLAGAGVVDADEKKETAGAAAPAMRDESMALGESTRENAAESVAQGRFDATLESLATRTRAYFAREESSKATPELAPQRSMTGLDKERAAPATRPEDGTTEVPELRDLATAWTRLLDADLSGGERREALAALVRIRARLIELDPGAECDAALDAADQWRRTGASDLDADTAAERIERSCAR
jgi:hypothetical protein